MVYSTVTRKCSVLTQPKEGCSRVSVSLHGMSLLNALLQESGDFSPLTPPSLLILSHPDNASCCLRSLLMVSSVLEDHLSLVLEKHGY